MLNKILYNDVLNGEGLHRGLVEIHGQGQNKIIQKMANDEDNSRQQ
jgi:hypothetical protein